MDYFYDEQLRKYRIQFARLFSGFMVKTGKGRGGKVQNRPVPVHSGNISRMVAHILKKQSENTVLSTPTMSYFITGISPSKERRQAPIFSDTSLIDERKYNSETGEYESGIGDRFTVERVMPVPYDLTFQLDIYTSNEYEKDQILEQILMLFNPSLDLQRSNSPLDWTAISQVEMLDDMVWDSRQIPVGETETISVASLKFRVEIWISPPANVTRRKAVDSIMTNLQFVRELHDYDINEEVTPESLKLSFAITPNDYRIELNNFNIKLMENHNGKYYAWSELEKFYTDDINSDTIITIKHRFGNATGITGKVVRTDDPQVLRWVVNPDDLYQDTIPNIDMIIDPTENYPGDGSLPPAEIGQRYLLATAMPVNAPAWAVPLSDRTSTTWGYIDEDDIYLTGHTDTDPLNVNMWRIVPDAQPNDIIEYNGTEWFVVFDSDDAEPEIVTSLLTSKQYRWSPEINEWQPTIDKIYFPGTWSINFTGE